MCHRYASAMMATDTEGAFEFVPYQLWDDPAKTPELLAACEKALHLRKEDGTWLLGADAVFYIYQTLGWRWARVARMPPLIWVFELGYKVVAANRLWFSKVFYTGDEGFEATCKLEWTPELQAELQAEQESQTARHRVD